MILFLARVEKQCSGMKEVNIREMFAVCILEHATKYIVKFVTLIQ